MIVNIEQLWQKARELALIHELGEGRWQTKKVLRELLTVVDGLQSFAQVLKNNETSCSQPAEEWLLDHAEFIQEQSLVIKRQLTSATIRNLPRLHKSGQLRVDSICADYLVHADGVLDVDSFVAYINAYQEISVLTMAEAWVLPLLLRITILHRLSDVMAFIRNRHDECLQVQRMFLEFEPTNYTASFLNQAMDQAELKIPLSGSYIVQLISYLSERADDITSVREWLMCKVDNGAEGLDHIISYEHQLQANLQVSTASLIQSLRKVARLDWRDAFELICKVEHILSLEPSGIYPHLDFTSRNTLRKRIEALALRLKVPENLIARQAVDLAGQIKGEGTSPRMSFIAYYLLEPAGVANLQRALRMCSQPKRLPEMSLLQRASGAYFSFLMGFFLLGLIGFSWWIGWGLNFTVVEWIIIAMALVFPVSEWAITVTHWMIGCTMPSNPLLRYNFSSGIAADAATLVVIPVIWSTPEEVRELADRLELHYLANRDPHIHFALLGDFTDASTENSDGDEAVLAAARNAIEELNRTYAMTGTTFHLLQRRRKWNSAENVWMGWERKRGKLVEFVELIRGRMDTSYHVILGDPSVYPRIRYIITLDADTKLPIGSAQRMIGTLHLPFNQPRLNKTRTRVVEGYGVLQPRIGISHESVTRSRLASLWSGEPGIDPYAFAVSDPYQDGLGEGIFTGKGIFDVETFAELLCERIPENQVLSHDLLEGGFLRAGLLSDIELIDGHPATFSAYQQRLHRWVRGDWQLLCWLLPRVCNLRGELVPVDLSALTRWQIIDNLRRSLLPVALFLMLVLSLAVLPGSSGVWLTITLATIALPIIRACSSIKRLFRRPRSLSTAIGQVLVTFTTLPFQCALLLHAIAKSLFRLYVSKRNLLEWVNSAEIERRTSGKQGRKLWGVTGGICFVLIFALAVLFSTPALQWMGIIFCAIWVSAPVGIRWLDQPLSQSAMELSKPEVEKLRLLAQQIWAFFEDFAGEEDNWLAPDNVQIEPPNGVAHRTSPTNIGLQLACTLAARDFNFIDTAGLIVRLERTLDTLDRMEKWSGHLYNWYDTVTLAPLPPMYVSTVDSGNFVAYLVTVKEGLAEWLRADFEGGVNQGNEDLFRGQRLISRLEHFIMETDFRPLYDSKAQLFTLGYNATLNKRETILYDLLASEARQASFLAIAFGQVSAAHWSALGRTMTKIGKRITLISWSGTMFEYLMPSLLMRTYQNSLWDSTYRGVIERQIAYAKERGVPFGISESGYYAFDYQLNYQYQAFGVPRLGFKRRLEQDLVICPYATIMALPYSKQAGLDALQRIESLGGHGQYGFYEAIDFTSERMPKNQPFAIIQSFMAHHQGMSLLTLANVLLPQPMYERFHRDKRVQAAELLLQERIPANPAVISNPATAHVHVPETRIESSTPFQEFLAVDMLAPEVCVLSNGKYMSVLTTGGGGFSRCEGMAVTRWQQDPMMDQGGNFLYIRDVSLDSVWSPSNQPCRVESSKQRVQFSLERVTFLREDGEIATQLEICVSPEMNAEVRWLKLTNTGSVAKIIEVTSFIELALAPPAVDNAHPAFSKLFVQTEFDSASETLLARRRPRDSAEESVWAVHALFTDTETLGSVEYETNRMCFIGRGYSYQKPQGIRSRLSGTVGAVLDPAFILRRRFTIEPGMSVQLFAITGIAESREEAVSLVDRLRVTSQVERTFKLAWTRSEIELKHLHLKTVQAKVFQTLAGRVLFTAPYKVEQAKLIALNTQGQSGLWAHGISGDVPVVLVRIADMADLPFVIQLILGCEFLRRKGLLLDLVILNESEGGYQQELQDALRRTIEMGRVHEAKNRVGSIFPVAANQLEEKDRVLLHTVARIILDAGGSSLGAQLKVASRKYGLPEPIQPIAAIEHEGGQMEDGSALLFFNGWGGFTSDGKEYRILLRNGNLLPAPWTNVMANPLFGTLVTELGTGYTWWRNSRECKLTPWSNDPVIDSPGEVCYIRDEETGECWSTTPAPASLTQNFTITHGHGYTRYSHESHNLSQEMTIWVPTEDAVKIIEIRLQNNSDKRRNFSLTYYVEWVLGVRREENTSFIMTEWDSSSNSLLARNTYQDVFREAIAFLHISSEHNSSNVDSSESSRRSTNLTWTSDRSEFLGRNGTLKHPAAMKRQHLSGQTGVVYDSCGAIQCKFTIDPGGEQKIIILLGCEESRAAAVSLVQKYGFTGEYDQLDKSDRSDDPVPLGAQQQTNASKQSLLELQQFWGGVLEQITVSTPNPELNLLLNGWLLYQTLSCRIWARTAFYQAGGAYGFRDQLQDSLALLHSRPDLTRAQIILHASHQFVEGDVQHWWHEETKRGIRTRFSDDLLWLPYAVSRYLNHTEDYGLLEEVVPYIVSTPLSDDEHERYEPTVHSEQRGTIYEHCLRAIERSMRFGEHGLPLIGVGDWNDGLNRIGILGRGESVWLGWFLCDVLSRFSELCERRTDKEHTERYRKMRDGISAALNEHAWDGQWYRRAYTDHGQWLGSIQNKECRIDAIAQSWSVFSDMAPNKKAMQAMLSFDRELVDRTLSVAKLLTPPFDTTDPSPGYIQGYPPGIRENGAQYTHGAIWSVIAWCQLGEGDKAMELMHMLNPLTHAQTPGEVRTYAGEPYVMSADIYTEEPHKGRAGWTWYTGASGWMYQAGIEWILGLRRRGERLYITPCIPRDWPEFTLKYRYGSAVYDITVRNPQQKSTGATLLTVDGEEVRFTGDGEYSKDMRQTISLDQTEQTVQSYVTLHDDGQVHLIVLTI